MTLLSADEILNEEARMNEKKYVVLVETPSNLQKKLNQWLAQGYEIKIDGLTVGNDGKLIAIILRSK